MKFLKENIPVMFNEEIIVYCAYFSIFQLAIRDAYVRTEDYVSTESGRLSASALVASLDATVKYVSMML